MQAALENHSIHAKLDRLSAAVGNTSLLEIPMPADCARVFAKLEFQNPFGTIKDRVAFSMMQNLIRSSTRPIRRVLEYTGGSLGVSLAAICEELGIPLTLVVSHVSEALASYEKRGVCTLERVDPKLGFWAVMERAKVLAVAHPDWHFLYQHENAANLLAHREGTGREIHRQLLDSKIFRCDAWVASIGTGGSLIGVYEALQKTFPQLRLVAVSPAELPYGSEGPPNGQAKFAGSGGLGCGRKQSFVEPYHQNLHEHFEVSFPEAIESSAEFKKRMGFSIGSSSGANLIAASKLAKQLGPDKVVVTVFPSAF